MSNDPAGSAPTVGRAATITAIALILVFIAMLVSLAIMRGDEHWDRLVYLLTGFEAIVFAGAGALFGTVVQRETVTDARNDAAQAKQEAQVERARADDAAADATAGRTLRNAVIAKAEGRTSQESLPSPELDELSKLARNLFPQEE